MAPIDDKEAYSEFHMMARDVKELRNDYYGNGKKGTKVEVIEMKKDHENFKKVITAKLNTNSVMTTLVLVALVGNLIRSFF